MAKLVLHTFAFTVLVTFGTGAFVHAQEAAPIPQEMPTAPAATAPAPAEAEKKMEGEKERKGKKGKKAGRGKKKGRNHGRA